MTVKANAPVRAAFTMWNVAIGAGVVETILMIVEHNVTGSDLIVPLGIRTLVTVFFGYLAWRMLAGSNGARIALAVLLGIGGLASLVVEPVGWLLTGGSVPGAVAAADAMALTFASVRIVHILAVLCGVGLMFTPAAGAWFRSFREGKQASAAA